MKKKDKLERFVEAQNRLYDKALKEITAGKKKTHWMWFIFPQIKGLGSSEISKYYAIQSIKEAEAYIKHSYLGSHLLICCHELMKQPTDNAVEIFGEIDAKKLQSCMTLFYCTSKIPLFKAVLQKFYNGEPCRSTIEILDTLGKEEANDGTGRNHSRLKSRK